MPVNRNALIRYRTIDSCLRNRHRQWTLDDLIDACSDALYEYEGIDKGVSRRTVQADLETMRSGKLGYEAPIVVIDKKYYTYSDKNFTITNIPLDASDLHVLMEASSLLQQFKGLPHSDDLNEMITKLEDKIYAEGNTTGSVVEFERNELLTGLDWIETLRKHIIEHRCATITYQSFRARTASSFVFSPYLLKEYRNRWFVFGRAHGWRDPISPLALDRIKDITASDGPDTVFIPNTEVDLSTYFQDIVGVSRGINDQPRRIVFTAAPTSAPYLITKPIHASQHIIRKERGVVTFSLHVVINYELVRELLGFGADIVVLEPPELREHLVSIARQTVAKYEHE